MKPEELRIGNWIETDGLGEERVIALSRNTLSTKTYKDILYGTIDPIPLSPEWIQRFKWTNVYGAWTKTYGLWSYQMEKHPSNPNGWTLFIDIDGVAAPPSFKVDFVHHFQNIIHALTGEELNAEVD